MKTFRKSWDVNVDERLQKNLFVNYCHKANAIQTIWEAGIKEDEYTK